MTRTPATDPADLAPHVDRAWSDAFLLELRLRDVPGARIGDALAEVESHCRDSGEPADDAFGDPAEYARSLGLAGPATGGEGVHGVVVGCALQVVALFTVPTAINGVLRDGTVGLTGGTLAALGVTLVAIGLLAALGHRLPRLALDRPVLAWLALTVALAAAALPAALWRGTLVTVSSGFLLVGGLLLLGIGVSTERGALGDGDPVVAPDGSGGDPTASAAVLRRSRRTTLALTLMIPAATVLLTLFTWLAAR